MSTSGCSPLLPSIPLFDKMTSKDKVATKHIKGELQEKKHEHRHFKKSGNSDLINPQVFKKINPSDLPVIGIYSGSNISHIKMVLITYCQKELGPISKIFTEMACRREIAVNYEVAAQSDENDPLGIDKARIIGRMKQTDTDNLAYQKSKTKLYGIISSMTKKKVDEKLSVHRATIESERTPTTASTTATSSPLTRSGTSTIYVRCIYTRIPSPTSCHSRNCVKWNTP